MYVLPSLHWTAAAPLSLTGAPSCVNLCTVIELETVIGLQSSAFWKYTQALLYCELVTGGIAFKVLGVDVAVTFVDVATGGVELPVTSTLEEAVGGTVTVLLLVETYQIANNATTNITPVVM